jgi:hypothetical protein
MCRLKKGQTRKTMMGMLEGYKKKKLVAAVAVVTSCRRKKKRKKSYNIFLLNFTPKRKKKKICDNRDFIVAVINVKEND